MLYPILIYPSLLLCSPKCPLMHYLCKYFPEIDFTTFSIVYLYNLYNIQPPIPLDNLCSTCFPLYIPIIYAFGPKDYIYD